MIWGLIIESKRGNYLNNSLMYLHGIRENLGVLSWENMLLAHVVFLPTRLHLTNFPFGKKLK